jgi:hypothetical protein
MTTISIVHFKGYTEEMFREYLALQEPDATEIIIPKMYGINRCKDLMVCDYCRALYIGQQLAAFSEEVSHSDPDPNEPGEFRFWIKCPELTALATLLARLVKAYDFENHHNEFFDFDEFVLDFDSYLEEGDVIACPDLFDMINSFG